ncbi:MAG: NadR type nicotinamide-nucleotide adenylyltransferase [Roseivirga sp.]|jgi:NadR type nicotinamide-nucleotide adenylyltransferase
MILVAIVGPESTGKSTLTKSLSEYYQTIWSEEYAREYLTTLERPYEQSDLLEIAKGQLEIADKVKMKANSIVFHDTDLLVIKVWSEFKYGDCDPWIINQFELNKADLYLLTDTNIPYEEDPLRENPEQRRELFEIYEQELIKSKANYQVVKGDLSERVNQSITCINLMR